MMRRRRLMVMQDEEEYFVPDYFDWRMPAKVKIGRRFGVSVEASIDVKKITVTFSDGTVVGEKTQEQANNSSPPLRYSIIVTAPTEKGDLIICVYGTNENGDNTETFSKSITVY